MQALSPESLLATPRHNGHGSAQVAPGDFTFDVVPETFQLNITYKGVQEAAGSPLPRMQVANLERTASRASWLYPDSRVSVLIEKKENYLDITIQSEGAAHFLWPELCAESYTLPLWEGKYIPAKDSSWKSFLKGGSYDFLESFSMGFLALNKPHFSIVYVVKNLFNNEVQFGTDPDINLSFTHQFPSINKKKTYGFRIYITEANPVAVCNVYKQYIREEGRFKTLEEKAADNPNVRKLYGAPHIYFWSNGLIAQKNIHWEKLQASWTSNERLFAWVVQLLKNYDEKDAATEFNQVWQECKKQHKINVYQEKIITGALNKVLSMRELYNADVFSYPGASPSSYSLSEQQVYVLNKILLKGALKEAIDNPELWGKEDVAVLDDMYKSGITRAWIGLPDWADGLMNPLLVEKANQLGYLVGPYDSYHSIHQQEDRSWRTNWFPDSSLFNNATVTNASGRKIVGFLGRGRQLNPTLALPFVKQRVANILNDNIPYNSWFVDCDAYGEVFDDYSPNHITTQEEDFRARLTRMEYIGKETKMVVGSEGGNDFTSCSLAFAQGMDMPVFNWNDPNLRKNTNSPYYLGGYWAPAGKVPPIYAKPVPIKPLYQRVYVDPVYSLPLFRLVYNDAVITTPHWEFGSLKLKDEVSTRMLSELLYNTPPLYHLDQGEWKQNRKRMVDHVKVWSQLHRKAVTLPMTAFNILSDDRMVQQTVFGDKLKVTVNFSKRAIKVGRQRIAARSAIIEDGGRQKKLTLH